MSLSHKFLNLKKAQDAGLNTPRTLVLGNSKQSQIYNFLKHSDSISQFIIRSIQNCEDNTKSSYAGHFWSSPAFPSNEIEQTLLQAQQENQKILDQLGITETPQLMLQEFIHHSVGGVLFNPWGFFSEYAMIEYADSVQMAVEGQTKPALICTDEEQASPLPLPENLLYLLKPLQTLIHDLQLLFSFPLDCEWVYCDKTQQIIILQIRPQTSQIGAILGAPEQSALPTENWQYTALSESLGRLSPLSFSLLQQLYEDSKVAFQSLGLRAEQVNFMSRQVDGSILCDPKLEQAFYKTTKMGGFWRGFRAPQWQKKATDFLQTWQADTDFSYSQLSQSFQLWMIANLLSKGEGRNQTNANSAYELSWLQQQSQASLTLLTTSTTEKNPSWESLNPLLKQCFFTQLEKLKIQLSSTPEQAFSTWKNQNKNDVKTLLQKQHSEAPKALYDYSMLGNTTPMQSIGAKKEATGRLFFIQNPSLPQCIPDNCILVAPYFNNHWVHDIKRLSAIIVQQGGQLSHSAIVAREHGIPYIVMDTSALLLENRKHGDTVTLAISGEIIT